MNHKECEAINARLPPRFRGRSGHRALLESLTLRVSVSGTRGKSALTKATARALHDRGLSVHAKVTGTDPLSFKDGQWHPIKRDPKHKAILEENMWEVKRYWPMDACVLENQGITPYTMNVFNELFVRPNYLFIANVRRDHAGDLARSLPRMAKAFAHSAPRKTTLVNGERDPGLIKIMERVSKDRGVRFLDASPKRMEIPGLENISILDTFLKDWIDEGLTASEQATMRAQLQKRFTWGPSSLKGVMWFHGAEINDVDSTRDVFRYLQKKRRLPTTMVAYFRHDRTDRTATFIPYLRSLLKEGEIERVVVGGHRASMAARILRRHGAVWEIKEKPGSVKRLMELLARECQGGAVMTVANGVPPWPKEFALAMHPQRSPAPETKDKTTRRLPAPVGGRSPRYGVGDAQGVSA